MGRLRQSLHAIPVRSRTAPRPEPVPERVLEPGQLSRFEDGSVWKVERVTQGSAEVRCVVGGRGENRAGKSTTISRSSVGHDIVTEAEAEGARAAAEVLKSQCDGCWAKHPPDEPCPVDCWCHDGKYRRGPRAAGPADEDKARVLAMRAEGMGYAAIEKAMGWKDSHGARAWKIVKAAEKEAACIGS